MTNQHKRWRFSLREVVLAITAIAAVLGLIVSHRPFTPSSFHASLDVDHLLETLSKSLGTNHRVKFGEGDPVRSPHGAHYHREIQITSPQTPHRHLVMVDLRVATEDSLSENGCTVHYRRFSYDPNTKQLESVSFRYRYDKMCGFIYARSLPETGGTWNLLIVGEEW